MGLFTHSWNICWNAKPQPANMYGARLQLNFEWSQSHLTDTSQPAALQTLEKDRKRKRGKKKKQEKQAKVGK